MGGTIGTIKYLRPHFQPDVRRGTFSKSTPIYGGGTFFDAFSIRPHFQRYYLKFDPIFSGTIFQVRPPFQRYYFSISTPFSGPQNDQNGARCSTFDPIFDQMFDHFGTRFSFFKSTPLFGGTFFRVFSNRPPFMGVVLFSTLFRFDPISKGTI